MWDENKNLRKLLLNWTRNVKTQAWVLAPHGELYRNFCREDRGICTLPKLISNKVSMVATGDMLFSVYNNNGKQEACLILSGA